MADDSDLKGGPDDQMREDFRTVAQASAPDGGPRHRPGTLRRLARLLTGAGAGNGRQAAVPPRDSALFELSHLVAAAQSAGGEEARWLFFLGQDRVSAESCRHHFAAWPGPDGGSGAAIEASAEGVTVGYGGDGFTVTYARMPVLVALFEFLASMEAGQHLPALLDIFDTLAAQPVSRRRVQDASNAAASLLRGYLSGHLATAGNDDVFASIARFLQQRADGGNWRIDDAAVLAFWQQENLRNFRTYEKAFRRFVDLMAALATAGCSQAAAEADRLGADRENGEIEPEDLAYDLNGHGEWQSPLSSLGQAPANAIKFFTGPEQRTLTPLASYGPEALRLPLAFLRLDVFGAQQTAISQALRRLSPADVGPLVTCADAVPYAQRRDSFASLRAHVAKLQLATLHAICGDRANVVPLRRQAADENGAAEGEAALRQRTARAFGEVKRRGFESGGLQQPQRIEGFRLAAEPLTRIGRILDRYLAALADLNATDAPLDRQFATDRRLFAAEFRKIYGDAHA